MGKFLDIKLCILTNQSPLIFYHYNNNTKFMATMDELNAVVAYCNETKVPFKMRHNREDLWLPCYTLNERTWSVVDYQISVASLS